MLIETKEGGHRTYLVVDTKCHEIFLTEKKNSKSEKLIGIVKYGNDLFNKLPTIWQDYCIIAWRNWER